MEEKTDELELVDMVDERDGVEESVEDREDWERCREEEEEEEDEGEWLGEAAWSPGMQEADALSPRRPSHKMLSDLRERDNKCGYNWEEYDMKHS